MTLLSSDSLSARLLSVLYAKLDPIKISDSERIPNNKLSHEIENVVDYLLERCPHWSSKQKSTAKEVVMKRIGSLGRTAMAQEIFELATVQKVHVGRRVAGGLAFVLVWIVVIAAMPIALIFRLVSWLCCPKRFDLLDLPQCWEEISEAIESLTEKIWPQQPECYCCQSPGKPNAAD